MLIVLKSIDNFSSIGNANILVLIPMYQGKGTLKDMLDLNEVFIGTLRKRLPIKALS